MKHSQRLSVPSAKAWIAAERNGVVVCAHRNCYMAGPGEACSCIAGILFTLDANVHAKKSMSCTSLPCSWLPPSFRTVPFAPISDIEFQLQTRNGQEFVKCPVVLGKMSWWIHLL